MTFAEAAQPRRWKGSPDLGILMIHGFTSTPGSVSDWAEGLHKGTSATVALPLLPGHGTTWQDLNQVVWQDWEKTVLEAYDELAATHKRVIVAGLSLGGLLAFLVAARRPSVTAVAVVNHLMWTDNPLLPFAPVLKLLIPSTPAIAGDIKKPGVTEPAYTRVPSAGADQFRRLMKTVRPLLKTIEMPVLMFKSREDHVIPVFSSTRTVERLASNWVELVWLEDSYHVATLDNDLPKIIEKSTTFVKEVVEQLKQ